jgi:acetyl esterase
MDVTMDNASQNPAPFVDQRPNGPGVSKVDPSDPAAPMYRLLAKMRSPVTLRDLMIHPVRTGYIGQEQPLTEAELPKSAAELYPQIGVSEVAVPSPAGRIRCQVFSPPASAFAGGARPMMLYLHGGGFTVGQSEDTALHHEQDSGGKRDGGGERQLPSRAGMAVSGLPR